MTEIERNKNTKQELLPTLNHPLFSWLMNMGPKVTRVKIH